MNKMLRKQNRTIHCKDSLSYLYFSYTNVYIMYSGEGGVFLDHSVIIFPIIYLTGDLFLVKYRTLYNFFMVNKISLIMDV